MTLMRAWEADARQRRLGGADRHLMAEEASDVGDRRHRRRSDSSPRDGLDRFTRTLSRLCGIRDWTAYGRSVTDVATP